jgi:hypothetical protein
VQEHDRLAGGIAAFLPVNLMAVADGEMPVAMRLDRWVQFTTRVHASPS